MSAPDRIRKWQGAIDALTLRERLMLFVGLLVVMGGLWEALLAGPLEAREQRASARIAATGSRVAELDAAMELAAQGIGGGMSGHVERRRSLEQQIEAAEETVRLFTSDLVDPGEMRHVLEQLIARQRGLTLVRAQNLEVRPLLESETAASGPMLYRHGLRLELEGSYLDCLEYLEAVEALPWRLYWGSFGLSATGYPQNAIVIELYTLSLDEDWIGV